MTKELWTEFTLGADDPLNKTLEIIDDALCYGFIFKVENHKLYWTDAQ